ncbi:MAG: transglycosylase SLT domain-containing protein, partial [Solirubrobacterales bacterium]|nr:transglycosylase SLT domain-containing protein [Solirubrobacterales bacterium]
RELEAGCRDGGALAAAARGRLCFAVPRSAEWPEGPEALLGRARADLGAEVVIAVCDPRDFRVLLDGEPGHRSALIKTDRGAAGSLIALLAAEMRAGGVPLRAWVSPIGSIAGRRALAGIEPGGDCGRRADRLARALVPASATGRWRRAATASRLRSEAAQALPAVLGIAILIVAIALILTAIGGAATAKGRLQRSADLAAISAARSMRDDYGRLFVAPVLPNGLPNPARLSRSDYLARARAAAELAAERNDLAPGLVDVRFPGRASLAPLRVLVAVDATIGLDGEPVPGAETAVAAKAAVTVAAPAPGGSAAVAEGGGYAGPLAVRQGKPMRPDVAPAFDRMAAAARSAGISLVIASGYRSDAEQQRLWDANPDPRWVAPPGTSLHRCGTELDLGPGSAYGWLAANASRFGFVQRYSWEPWHYGYDAGPPPCSAAGSRAGSRGADGGGGGGSGLPAFVPARFRAPILAAASRHDVSAALLAAQLMAESGFDPNAVSPAGALGIAQFMPATAAAYGLHDPFEPAAAIDAQARLMAELLGRFGSPELALAAYNAGPGAVEGCGCVPPYPETQAYVSRILALLDAAGALPGGPPVLEVRLVA